MPPLPRIPPQSDYSLPPPDPSRFETAYRRGDRRGGAKSARLVNSKRTPTGGFFDPS